MTTHKFLILRIFRTRVLVV